MLLHLIDIAPPDPDADPVKGARTIVAELKKFAADLAVKERWLLINKIDLLEPKEAERRSQGNRAAAAMEGAGIADFRSDRRGHR